ncbi:MAG TPA: hypothetical protein VF678_15200 [bacterium]
MDLKAKNSITDRVQYTGRIVNDQDWIRDGEAAVQSEGTQPAHKTPANYQGPDRRQRRDRQEFARTA